MRLGDLVRLRVPMVYFLQCDVEREDPLLLFRSGWWGRFELIARAQAWK